eukprot:Gregarina_sp_Pseudo_9__75@NODE_1050_length_1930_cov_75_789001_g983_i0_p1_GENE_NODE_1050_length_1930_cov_75_789001_g983_i0NODE_1050_length_1930_cov_75_789001_g983_i0_p1_ORF_typecomplete_len541_score112_45Kelch_1/PF01344_25/2_2e09Kelch_1/PF01344_25/1_7e06Kelch_1/PF01344_25/0_74Kelch_6/PF13964_6/6_2e08Kelch_6/PF13964_6/0_0025Kelch_6/PF13964_6/4_2Kelch_4/PF13418_6/0_0025Kelch_4/PF13418_6/0_15Kelch_4/PF13418_6/1_3Kelch_3/PF13415_6/0_16Kelch_3/PF13415_6/14Kelch_3/PF13415_6/1_4e03Kelch_5/PF13854_6/25Ke
MYAEACAVLYLFEGRSIKPYYLSIVPAKDTDNDREVPHLIFVKSTSSSARFSLVNSAAATSCCSPVVERDNERWQHLVLVEEDAHLKTRCQVSKYSWPLPAKLTLETPRVTTAIELVERQTLPPLNRNDKGREIVWCAKSSELLVVGAGGLVEALPWDRRAGWQLRHKLTEDDSPKKGKDTHLEHPGVAAVDDDVYMVGGRCRSPSDCAWRYDSQDREWTKIASMKEKRERFALCLAGRYLLAIGGNSGVETLSSIEFYDRQSNQWSMSRVHLARPREKHKAIMCGRFLVVCGGQDKYGRKLSTLESVSLHDVLLTDKTTQKPRACFEWDGPDGEQVLAGSALIDTEPWLLPESKPAPKVPAAVITKHWSETETATETRLDDLARELSAVSTTDSSTSMDSRDGPELRDNAPPESGFAETPRDTETPRDAETPRNVETPRDAETPFMTPREVTWAPDVGCPRTLGTIREKTRKKLKWRDIHSRGVQTDDAFIVRCLYAYKERGLLSHLPPVTLLPAASLLAPEPLPPKTVHPKDPLDFYF